MWQAQENITSASLSEVTEPCTQQAPLPAHFNQHCSEGSRIDDNGKPHEPTVAMRGQRSRRFSSHACVEFLPSIPVQPSAGGPEPPMPQTRLLRASVGTDGIAASSACSSSDVSIKCSHLPLYTVPATPEDETSNFSRPFVFRLRLLNY